MTREAKEHKEDWSRSEMPASQFFHLDHDDTHYRGPSTFVRNRNQLAKLSIQPSHGVARKGKGSGKDLQCANTLSFEG